MLSYLFFIFELGLHWFLFLLAEPDGDMIMVEGISQLCNDLQVMSIYFHL